MLQIAGNPCLKGLSDEATDSQGVSKLNNTGNVSYINALQQGPNYAIGQLGNSVIESVIKKHATTMLLLLVKFISLCIPK
ncbi:hypothetical protein P4S63_24000 [Pseudoalteromonas sp. B193]